MEATLLTALVTVGIEKVVKLVGGLMMQKPWNRARRSEVEEIDKLLLEIKEDLNGLKRVLESGYFDESNDKHSQALVDLREELKKFDKDLGDMSGRMRSVKMNELQALRRQIGRSFRDHVIRVVCELNKDIQQLGRQVANINNRDVQFSNHANFLPQQCPLNINIENLLVQLITTQDPKSNNQMQDYKALFIDHMAHLKANEKSKPMGQFIEGDTETSNISNNLMINCKAPPIKHCASLKLYNDYNTQHLVQCNEGDYTINDDEPHLWDAQDNVQAKYASYKRFWEHDEDIPFDHSNPKDEIIDNIFESLGIYLSN